MFPKGSILRDVWWEAHDGRIRKPEHVIGPKHKDPNINGELHDLRPANRGIPLLVGVPYKIPLETSSDVMVTGHGNRSISGAQLGIDINLATQKQLEAIPGIGENSAWSIISKRAKMSRNSEGRPFPSVSNAFEEIGIELTEMARNVLISD